MTKETIKLFGVEIRNVSSYGEESTSDKDGMSCTSRSCKGKRWSEDEQRAFLIGLDKLGKGNWTRIAKEFVPSIEHQHKLRVMPRNILTDKKRTEHSNATSLVYLTLIWTKNTQILVQNWCQQGH
ncbi:hypothetical protein RDI58_012950 [Solanum bulbocastanum]|uniref:HTH myb-type domain-containing protein n=1 Tax=Solanum bulbocastanum TaxID=147425 RepID=A0AAN8TP97_SOLBU